MTKKLNFLIFLSVFLLFSCENEVENRGYVTKFSNFNQIVKGHTTREDVQTLLGSPTTTSVYGKEQWIYIGSEETKETFFEPEIKVFEAYVITFNDEGIVTNMEKKDRDSMRKFQISSDKTHTGGSELTVMQQLLGNLGKFNPVGNSNKGARTPPGL